MIHLHLHTSYSLWDGYGDVEEYLEHASDRCFVLTEHNNMFSYIKFKKAGLNCYAGVELSILDNYAHITLIAKNERGYARLNQLTMIDRKRRGLDVVFDEEYKEDIIYLTGCTKTYFNTDERRFEILQYIEKGFDVVVECVIYPHFEHIFMPNLYFAKKMGIPFVLTNDVHFLRKEHWLYNDIVNCINSKAKFNDENRFRYDTSIYLMREDEFIEKCAQYGIDKEDVLQSFKNAERVVERAYNGIPKVQPIKYDVSLRDYIKQNAFRKIEREYESELKKEIELIERKGFSDVFILTNEIVKRLRQEGILMNYGRGSAAGSLVSYVLGITHVHPKLYKLDFSRFINEYRNDYPDIDIDVPSKKRDYVEQIVREMFQDNVTRLNTLARFTSVSLANDLSRVFDYNYEAKTVDYRTFIVENKLYEIVTALEGKPRHAGTHPAGFCFGQNIAKTFANIDMEDASFLNLIKLDFLGLSTMDIIQTYYEKDNINYIEELDTYKIHDLEIQTSDVGTAGVFQFEAESCSKVADLINPNNISGVIDVISLSRAPSLSNNAHIRYCKMDMDEFMKELLPETRGVLIYQEQLLELLRKYSSMNAEEIERARKIISKLKVEEFEQILDRIRQDFLQHFSPMQTEMLIRSIENSAQYMFNKAHATSYGHLTFLTMYLKMIDYAKYVAYYINSIDDDERIMRVIAEARTKGVRVHLPKITMANQYTDDKAMLINGQIYLTDKCIKFRSKKDHNKIVSEYAEKIINNKKTFGFYPFRLHDDIKEYRKRFVYASLKQGYGTFVTLCYVVSFYPYSSECVITDGYSVVKCYIADGRLNEIIRNSEKMKTTLIVKIRREPGKKDTILNAKVYERDNVSEQS